MDVHYTQPTCRGLAKEMYTQRSLQCQQRSRAGDGESYAEDEAQHRFGRRPELGRDEAKRHQIERPEQQKLELHEGREGRDNVVDELGIKRVAAEQRHQREVDRVDGGRVKLKSQSVFLAATVVEPSVGPSSFSRCRSHNGARQSRS